VTVQTSHPSFEVKTLNKFEIPQIERMKITFSDKSEFKPLTFLGISASADGADIKLYTKEDLKANPVIEFNRSHFYTFYPIKQHLVVAMGEESFNRMSLGKTADVPTNVMETKDL
jgi:hypothetical protein